MNMIKVTSLSLPKEQIDKIMEVVHPPKGEEKVFDFVLNDEGGLDLYAE